MKRVGIIGGYGALGAIVARELTRLSEHAIVIGGRDKNKAARFAKTLGPHASGESVDAESEASLTSFLSACDAVVYCGPSCSVADGRPSYERRGLPARIALKTGCHFLDVGAPEPLHEIMAPYDTQLKTAGLSCLSATSWVPGLSELLFLYVFNEAKKVLTKSIDEVSLFAYCGCELAPVASRDLVAAMRFANFKTKGGYREGLWEPSAKPQTIDFEGAIGKKTVYPAFRKYLKDYLEAQGMHRQSNALGYYLALGDEANRVTQDPRFLQADLDGAAQLLHEATQRDQKQSPGEALVAVASGEGAKGQVTIRANIVTDRAYWVMGLIPAVATLHVLGAAPTLRGCHHLHEAVEPAPFIQALHQAGLPFEIERNLSEARIAV